MFKNIGKKIKKLAIAICIINILLFFSFALYICNNITEKFIVVLFLFIGIVTLGVLVAWLSSIFIYGFGQLVENSDIITSVLLSKNNEPTSDMKKFFDEEFFQEKNQPIDENAPENSVASNFDTTFYFPDDL